MNKVERLSHFGILLIALCALFISIWQVRIVQQHNRLTVKPYLDYSIIQEEDSHRVTFSNQGFGPAILKELSFVYQGKKYDGLYQVLDAAGERKNVTGSYTYGENSIFAPGVDKLLVHLRERRFRNIQVVMVYESIYEGQFRLTFEF